MWNPKESSVLLSGGYDKIAAAFDSRAPDSVATFSLTADVECMKWDPFKPEVFYVRLFLSTMCLCPLIQLTSIFHF